MSYRNKFYFCGFIDSLFQHSVHARHVNSGEFTRKLSKARRVYVKFVSDLPEFTHR